MPDSILQKVILPALIIVAGLAAVASLSGSLTSIRPPMPEGYEDYDLSINGSRFKGFVFGAEGLIADWYYMRALQYIGYKVLNAKSDAINIEDLRNLNPTLLHPLLANATDLDPHFIEAFSYGALVLPAIDPDKAIDLATKGIENNKNEWRLYQYLGYIYWRLGDYEKATETYERGSQIVGVAPFMKMMAAAMKTEGGSRETARMIYRQMLDGSEDEQVRGTAERRLQELDSLDEREAIDRVLAEFKERTGRCAYNLGEILPMLMTIHLPDNRDFRINKANQLVDPSDAAYLLDKENCSVGLDVERTKLPIK